MSLFVGILIALVLDILVLYTFTILFPNGGKLRQYVVIFVAEAMLGWRDFYEDVVTIVMLDNSKKHMTPKQRMNGLLDNYMKQYAT